MKVFKGIVGKYKKIVIDSRDKMEEAALYYGALPFFHNTVRGFSVAEMTLPGLLFGGDEGFDGCWEWKGPVIRRKTAAYGKFFKRKAGFVSLDLLPDFLNYRHYKYPVKPDSTDEMILEIIRENDGLTSTDLRKLINGTFGDLKRFPDAMPTDFEPTVKIKRSSLEGPLQRLQMGGWLIIDDFKYKQSSRGERYGWGVASYSTPELWFGDLPEVKRSPEESLDYMAAKIAERWHHAAKKNIGKLLE